MRRLPTELNETLISLLQSLGLFSQATNVKENAFQQNMNTHEVVETLTKFNLKFSVLTKEEAQLDKTIYPFIVLGDKKGSYVLRRKNASFQKLISPDNWHEFNLSDLENDEYVITIDGIPNKLKKKSVFATLLSKRKKWLFPVIFLSLLSSLAGVVIPLFTMVIYDRVIGGQSSEILPGIAVGAIISLFILVASRLIRSHTVGEQSVNLAREMSALSFYKLIHLPYLLLSRVSLANHLSRLQNAEKIRTLLSGSGAGLIDVPFTIIVFLTIAFLSGWLVLVPMVMLTLYYLIMLVIDKYVQAAMPTISIEYQDALNELSENIVHLKSSGYTGKWKNTLFRLIRENTRQNFLYSKRNGLNAAVSQGLSSFTTLATVFAGIFLVLDQSITPGELIACVMLIGRLTGPLQLAFMSRHKIHMMKMSVNQFDRFMNAEIESTNKRLKQVDVSVAPALSFSQVSLRYSADTENAMSGVSADIGAGELIAIVGPSGAGKSSLLLTALSIVEAQSGVILLNGLNIKQYDPETLRRFIGFSSAEPIIFPGSLRDNLVWPGAQVSDDEIKNMLSAAGGDVLLNALDNDLDKPLFSDGKVILTALEGSYVSLARVLIKKSKFIILDDPIGNHNERAKQCLTEKLLRLKGHSTVLMATHDKDLIKVADKVLVLDKGSVVFFDKLPEKSSEEKPDQSTAQIIQEFNINE